VRPLCLAANGAWLASSLPAALAFHANLHRAAEVQEAVLLRILRRNAATPFGRAHGFTSIASVREYQECVPVRTYDEYTELQGGASVLTASPVTHYEQTSGSSGASKRIPYTRDLRAEMGRAIAPWIVDLFRQHPAAFAGGAYWSVSPVLSSSPTDSVADEDHLGPMRARLVRAVQAVPGDVRFLQDVETFRQTTLQHLLRCRTLSLISVWHPSFLLLLLGELRDQAADLWPNLRVISCWTDANAARDAAELARLFPHAHIQPKGLLSTEGFVSIPIADAAAPALAYRSHFYELRDAQTGRILLATEGKAGQRYGVILTTGAGLYRYDTEDLVEIAGYREACPLLRFIGRARHISDHYGEKLHELFVRERLENALREHHINAAFAMLACEDNGYALFLETDAPDIRLLAVPRALDDALRDNIHYDYCRRLGQLRGLRLFRIDRDASATYLATSGQRLGDVKLSSLDARQGWSGRFRGTWLPPRPES
jgi:GH3 auxin-responsive promoter